MPITRRCTHLQYTHTYTHSSHPLSSYNPSAKPSLSMRTPHPAGPCQGKLERRGGFCFEALCEKGKKKNPNHFLNWSNLTCCDNCSVRNFFDISEREDFLAQNQDSIKKKTVLKRAPNSLGLFNYARWRLSLLVYVSSCHNRGKNKLAPALIRLFHFTLFFSTRPSLGTISHLPFTLSPSLLVPGVILCLEEQSPLFRSIILSFVFSPNQ